jgi:hypothetical protein
VGDTNRLFEEQYFADRIAPEIGRLKAFYEAFDRFTYATRHGAIQLHDSFATGQNLYDIQTGGIHVSDLSEVFTGCNSLNVSAARLRPSGFSLGPVKDGIATFRGAPSWSNLVSAVKNVGDGLALYSSLSYYYFAPLDAEYPTSEGWPIVQTMRMLRDVDCADESEPVE